MSRVSSIDLLVDPGRMSLSIYGENGECLNYAAADEDVYRLFTEDLPRGMHGDYMNSGLIPSGDVPVNLHGSADLTSLSNLKICRELDSLFLGYSPSQDFLEQLTDNATRNTIDNIAFKGGYGAGFNVEIYPVKGGCIVYRWAGARADKMDLLSYRHNSLLDASAEVRNGEEFLRFIASQFANDLETAELDYLGSYSSTPLLLFRTQNGCEIIGERYYSQDDFKELFDAMYFDGANSDSPYFADLGNKMDNLLEFG